ncbi:MAG TPA: hypothetical protein VFT85_07130 [Acidimicrobiia bacterium]|nr:hypothetical protein [Acidimicrobiia bacterium]
MTAVSRTLRLGDRRVPVVLPNRKDARLHTASVIISIHVIGITALGFRVSVPQILAAIVTAGLIDVALTLHQTGKLVWPASGMLTGSGVALILRLVGMDSGDYWSWEGWHWFALVAGVSILTKYVIRFRGGHVFNPSNVGLVAAFLLIGSEIVEPLDFWWAPLGFWMVVAYVLIVGGGVLITRRLDLLEMAFTYWGVLAAGLAVLAASGHCMVATWSPTPVCDGRFWTVLVTSPEILVFLFFMITDPKTIPHGRGARVVFAAGLGLLSVLMIAPHSTEYAAKVGLLASLTLWSPIRGLFDKALPDDGGRRSGVVTLWERLASRPPAGVFGRGMVTGVVLVTAAVGILVAGTPARDQALAVERTVPEVTVEVDPSTLPEVAVDQSVNGLDFTIDDEFVDVLSLTLAENLAIEAEAMRTADGSLLALSSGGARLDEMQALLDTAVARGERIAEEYSFSELSLALHEPEGEGQTSAGFVFSGGGELARVVFDATGSEVSRSSEPFRARFVMRQLAGDRWLTVEVEPGA